MMQNSIVPIPNTPLLDMRTGYPSREWYWYWSQPHFSSLSFDGQIDVSNGGTGLSSGNPGGIPWFNTSASMETSGVLGEGMIVFGGGGESAPSTPVGRGQANGLLVSNPNGYPSWFNLQDTPQLKWNFDPQSQSITPELNIDFAITGRDSVQVQAINGQDVVTLRNDVATPPNLSFYGSMTGTAGWQPFSSNFANASGDLDLSKPGNTTTGTLQAVTVDAWGRVTGTRAATITGTPNQIDVANGDASAGLPTISLDPVVLDQLSALAQFQADLLTSSNGAALITSAGDFITTSAA